VKMCAQQTNRRKDPVPRRYSSATGRSLRASRSGLAPLEMVLGLPLVLLLFALMVNAGFTGMWKLRLLGAASEAAWRDRDQRNGLSDPEYRSTFWKQPDPGREESPLTTSRGHAEDPLNIPDQASAEAVRADFRSLDVDSGLLDPKQDSYSNNANIRRHFPLLPDSLQMMQGNPNYMLVAHTLPYWKTRLPTMQCRRTKVLYNPVEEPEEASNEGHHDPTDYIMDTGYWPDAYQWGVGQRTIWGIETDIPGSSLPTLSEWTVHPSELGFDSFLSVADEYHNSLLKTNLLPVAGHNVTDDLLTKLDDRLTALGEMEAYHDPERYDWTYKGEFLDDGMVKWCWQKFTPAAPGFMPTVTKIISDDGAEWAAKIDPIIKKVEDDQDRLTKDAVDPDLEGNLPYHLANSYINFYQSAIDIVTHHVNHLEDIIDRGNAYLALSKDQQIPIMTNRFRKAMAGARRRLPAAQIELNRRERILSPVIEEIEDYQRDF
jgi:hypothetical protein